MNKSQALLLLGLKSGATKKVLKKHYRQAAIKHHPDKGGDVKMFNEIKKAYDFLIEFGTQSRIMPDWFYDELNKPIGFPDVSINVINHSARAKAEAEAQKTICKLRVIEHDLVKKRIRR